MQQWRRELKSKVAKLIDEGVSVDPAKSICETTFYLPYQGFNDRRIQAQIGRLHRSSHVFNARHSRKSGKQRVGFISRYFCNHTIGRLMRGLIAGLSRDDFEVTVISVGRSADDIARFIQASADRHLIISDRIPAACRTLAELELDVLLFTDIGMDPVTYTLAHSRFAPVQCATWGHPVTSGLPTIDYFLSSALFESDASQDHYSESLVRFATTGVHYFRPERISTAVRRAEFGLPDDRTLYGCPQSLFKLHPEFDGILGDILRRDPLGEVVLLSGSRPNWDRLLMERISRTIPDVADRIRFIGRQSYAQFLRLNTVFDVLLDPIHFSGGNTSFEALSSGVPIVTWPSEFLRGRITHGLYRRMNVLDCVARTHAVYVEIALRLANDHDFRSTVSRRILEASPLLFEDHGAIRELGEFLQSARPAES
jgi:predicted O-linked N-acetylglucosamine transferase (SPINDLY family)